jgi:hypothetical protein
MIQFSTYSSHHKIIFGEFDDERAGRWKENNIFFLGIAKKRNKMLTCYANHFVIYSKSFTLKKITLWSVTRRKQIACVRIMNKFQFSRFLKNGSGEEEEE